MFIRKAFIAALLMTALGGLTHAQSVGLMAQCPGNISASRWNNCVGSWTHPAGDPVYAGEFRNGIFHGYGVMHSGASVYAGEFVEGRFNGQGQLVFDDGSRYLGGFRQGVIEGFGRLIGADGSVLFVGEFVNGAPVVTDTPAIPQSPPRPDPQEPAPAPYPAPVTAAPSPPAPTAQAPAQAPAPAPAPAKAPAPPAIVAPPADRRPQSSVTAKSGFAIGRVTMADGSDLPENVESVEISINGISTVGERVSYQPIVNRDGSYQQRLAPGDYRFGAATITVRYKDRTFSLPLEPVGSLANRQRDAANGIVQDFVWKPNGPTPVGRSNSPDPGNHTHWYGMRVGVKAGGWRSEYTDNLRLVNPGKPIKDIPVGTKVTLTLRPLTRSLDGREVPTITIERELDLNTNTNFHDLPPADYELSGFAILPNGQRYTLVFAGSQENRLGFVQNPRVNIEWDTWVRAFSQRDHAYYLQ